jgi:atypical dual specificity phosphatase
MGRVVSKVLFWPTIPITVSRRIGKWTTEVDNAVVIGGAPFGFMRYPEKLARQFNIRGVVNMCEEYRGPVNSYRRLGIELLHLPTVDHFEPSVEDLKRAVDFIQKHEAQGGRVYVHCRAGHGRSAAAVFAWLLYKEPLADPADLNEKLCSMRNVRKGLWKQPNINSFHAWLKSGGMVDESDSEDYKQPKHRQSRKPDSIVRPADRKINHNDVSDMHLGQVFSDEESTTDYDSDFDDLKSYDSRHADTSEDERDYEIWRKYNKQ